MNFDVLKSQKIAITGQSGIGKSTLLSLMMGLIQPGSGIVEVNNQKMTVTTINKIRSLIAWLPQNVNILGKGKVEMLFTEIFNYKINRRVKPTNKNIIDLLYQLNLNNDILTNNFESLSGGEKQRIGIIICLLLKRPILILDEPTSALDELTKQKVADLIFNKNDLTVVTCSHDADWLKRCDLVYKIENKKIIRTEV